MKVTIHVERLVLEGVEVDDVDELRAAIERALVERLRSDPRFAEQTRDRVIRLEGGRFEVDGNASPSAIGEHIATQLVAAASP